MAKSSGHVSTKGGVKRSVKTEQKKPQEVTNVVNLVERKGNNMSNLTNLLRSKGIKRTIASLLEVLNSFAGFIPGIGSVIQALSALFGITGLTHAAGSGTLFKFKSASVVSILGLVVKATLFFNIAPLLPYVALMNQIIIALGGVAVGSFFASKSE